jgi:hypothetical protein
VGDIVKARDAREMKTIQGIRAAKCKRNGAEASSAKQIRVSFCSSGLLTQTCSLFKLFLKLF